MNKNDILHTAEGIINGERQGTYGNAEDNFKNIAEFWSTYLGTVIDSADVANMMILMKVARNASGVYKNDNWVDICGYAALGGEISGNQTVIANMSELGNAFINNKANAVGGKTNEE